MFEAQFRENPERQPWLFSTKTPSLADASLAYQLRWGNDIAAGRGIENLTSGGTADTNTRGSQTVFNKERHPRLVAWYEKFEAYVNGLEPMEKACDDETATIQQLLAAEQLSSSARLLPTPNAMHDELSQKTGLIPGAKVSIAPDDTGRDK